MKSDLLSSFSIADLIIWTLKSAVLEHLQCLPKICGLVGVKKCGVTFCSAPLVSKALGGNCAELFVGVVLVVGF